MGGTQSKLKPQQLDELLECTYCMLDSTLITLPPCLVKSETDLCPYHCHNCPSIQLIVKNCNCGIKVFVKTVRLEN